MQKISIALAEDSRFYRNKIQTALEEYWRTTVCASASSSQELNSMLLKCSCEVLLVSATLTAELPTYVADVIKRHEVPVIILTQDISDQKKTTVKCLDNGAIDQIVKPSDTTNEIELDKFMDELIQIIKRCATSRIHTYHESLRTAPTPISDDAKIMSRDRLTQRTGIIAIGASTGGPNVLTKILTELSKDIPVPIVIVQHMPAEFLEMFAEQLSKRSGWKVHLTSSRMKLAPSNVYLASGDQHMVIVKQDNAFWTFSESRKGSELHCPSIDVTFDSIAASMAGGACAILLTGMGEDGARGMKNIANMGGITIAENQSTALIFGMPAVAIALGGATHVLPSYEISSFVNSLF